MKIVIFWDFSPCILLDRPDVSDEPAVYTFTAEYEATRGKRLHIARMWVSEE
jgi:hypothetical protein